MNHENVLANPTWGAGEPPDPATKPEPPIMSTMEPEVLRKLRTWHGPVGHAECVGAEA